MKVQLKFTFKERHCRCITFLYLGIGIYERYMSWIEFDDIVIIPSEKCEGTMLRIIALLHIKMKINTSLTIK